MRTERNGTMKERKVKPLNPDELIKRIELEAWDSGYISVPKLKEIIREMTAPNFKGLKVIEDPTLSDHTILLVPPEANKVDFFKEAKRRFKRCVKIDNLGSDYNDI